MSFAGTVDFHTSKIVNFEDKDSNSGDGYIYQDLRPWLRTAGAGAISLTGLTPVSPTGDNAVGTAESGARGDHAHQGLHTIHVSGSGDLYGDIELAGPIEQAGNRLTIANLPMSLFRNLFVQRPSTTTVKITYDELIFQNNDNDKSAWSKSKSVTIDIESSGANGLAAGLTEGSNTWYYIWLWRKSSDGTVAGTLDTSFNNPEVPSGGYDQKALVSAVQNDNSSNFIDFIQEGLEYWYTTWQTMGSGAVGTASWTSVDLTNFVPNGLSTICFGFLRSSGSIVGVTNDSSVAAENTDAPNKMLSGNSSQINPYWKLNIITADRMYWLASGGDSVLRISGFIINKLG